MGIVEFLEARITEDEVAAKAARPGPWFHDSNLTCGPRVPPDDFLMVPADPSDTIGPCNDKIPDQDSRHIARHDPARILREVAAKRAIIEAADEATGYDMQVDGEFRVGRRDMTEEPYLGDVILRALAASYADHPDFNEEWRP